MQIFDGHSDLWMNVDIRRNKGERDIIENYHTERWKKGNVRGGFYPIFVDSYGAIPVEKQAESIIVNLKKELELCPAAEAVCNYSEYRRAINNGRHALILGAEGLSFIGTNVDMLNELYQIGFREASLTHNEENALATGANGDERHGLTAAGRAAVKRIHELNMILDLCHTTEKTFWDAVDLTDGVFMVSHGSCSALHKHRRNYNDDQLRAIAEHRGVIGICPYGPFLAESEKDQNLDRYIDHIIHAVNVAGIDCVGLGFDFIDFLKDVYADQSMFRDTSGLEDLSTVQKVVEALAGRGFTRDEIKKICHGNFERIIKQLLR